MQILMIYGKNPVQEITFHIDEHPEENRLVGNIYQAAGLSDFVRNVRLDALELDLLECFRVERNSGNLLTRSKAKDYLDREKLCPGNSGADFSEKSTYHADCTISLLCLINSRLLIKVRIVIDDINDNKPDFRQKNGSNSTTEIEIDENSPPGSTKVRLQTATDLDKGGHTPLYYHLEPTGTPFSLVHDTEYDGSHRVESLHLALARPLDYESRSNYWLNLTACDENIWSSSRTGVAYCTSQKLHVTVRNTDDELPYFHQKNYTITLKETTPTGQKIMTVKAEDKDEPPFNQIKYDILRDPSTSYKYFQVDPHSGAIRLAKSFPGPGQYKLYVLAFSTENLDKQFNQSFERITSTLEGSSNSALVNVFVVDVNNHSPRITPSPGEETSIYWPDSQKDQSGMVSSVEIQLKENIPAPINLAYITVSDEDHGLNAETKCSLRQHFEDGVKALSLNLAKKVYSMMELSQVSRLNEHVSVYKLVLKQTIDAEMFATDGQGKQRRRLTGKNGRLISLGRITIQCTDKGDPPLTGSMLLNLTVMDEDEFCPNIVAVLPGSEKPLPVIRQINRTLYYNISVQEDAPVGSAIIKFYVYDQDASSNPIFEGHGTEPHLKIDSLTGDIRVVKRFDYEQLVHSTFEVIVREFNSSNHKCDTTANIQVCISDANDNAPAFVEPPITRIPSEYLPMYKSSHDYDGVRTVRFQEEQPEGTLITHLKATDLDTRENAKVNFFLVEMSVGRGGLNYQPVIHIDPDGRVWSQSVLDRERTPVIDLLVGAHDLGKQRLTSYTSIRIILTDINDNSPEWQFPTKTDFLVSVSKEASVGSTITRVRATDPDEPSTNGPLSYGLLSAFNTSTYLVSDAALSRRLALGFLEVENSTGELKIKRSLRNIPDGFMDVWLQVWDRGSVPRQSTSKLVLYLWTHETKHPAEVLLSMYKSGSHSVVKKFRSLKNDASMITLLPAGMDAVDDQQPVGNYQQNKLAILIGAVISGIVFTAFILLILILLKVKRKVSENKKDPSRATRHFKNYTVPLESDQGTTRESVLLQPYPQSIRDNSCSKSSRKLDSSVVFSRALTPLSSPTDGPSISDRSCANDCPLFFTEDTAEVFHCQLPASSMCTSSTNTSDFQKTGIYSTVPSFIEFPKTIPLKIVTLSPTSYPVAACLTGAVSDRSCLNIPNILTSVVPVCRVQPDFIPSSDCDKTSSKHSTTFLASCNQVLLTSTLDRTKCEEIQPVDEPKDISLFYPWPRYLPRELKVMTSLNVLVRLIAKRALS
ncbi:unnamed protein product [Calicophoron daubneyi]|uniref:Cadherin domain-containing protein n=1 Tax=Calicophoron daubneyi TaxID=300641 RepID=A0AAV2TE78_CALDB